MDTAGVVFNLALMLAVEVCEKAVTDCIETLGTGPCDDGGIVASFLTDFFGFELEHQQKKGITYPNYHKILR
jgi:hypothetical protein